MATGSVRGRGVARVQPDELTVGLTVEALRRVAHDNPGHAEEYAAALGGRVGAIVSIADPETHPARREFEPMVLRAAAAMPLESGEQELVAEVDVTFQLEQP